jgi:segregation and condensation protein A
MSDLVEQGAIDAKSHLYHLNEFEGPLDLLLFLIKKNEVSIYDIPIATITEQFLSYIQTDANIQLEDLTEFYAMAASLLYIKSRMLLPVELTIDDDIDDPRGELIDKLIEYQKYKKLSELMESKALEAEWVVERKRLQRPLPFPDEQEMLWDKIEVWDLLRSFSSLMSNISPERIIDLYEEISINEKIVLMEELLEKSDSFMFTDLIIQKHSLLDIVCAFLAILEAVKMKMVGLYQHRLFGDIQIRRHRENPAKE